MTSQQALVDLPTYLPIGWGVHLFGREAMGSGNGSVLECRVSGTIMADGGLSGLSMRWARSVSGDVEGEEQPWVHAMIAVAPARNSTPQGKRSEVFLAQEDAAKFGITGLPRDAVVRDIEVLGEGERIRRIPVTVRGIIRRTPALSILAVDPTLGVLNVDGAAGTWTWRVPADG